MSLLSIILASPVRPYEPRKSPYKTHNERICAAAIFLLLIACSNVANLFLVRASRRARDLAVRTAMGASRWCLAHQLLAEALLLGGLGSALGFAFAWAGIHDLLSIAPANLPRRDAIAIDPAALAFSIAAGIGCALLFARAPALRAIRPDRLPPMSGDHSLKCISAACG